jgi:hypothetical protein
MSPVNGPRDQAIEMSAVTLGPDCYDSHACVFF